MVLSGKRKWDKLNEERKHAVSSYHHFTMYSKYSIPSFFSLLLQIVDYFILFLTLPNYVTILDNFTLFRAWTIWYHSQRFRLPFCYLQAPFFHLSVFKVRKIHGESQGVLLVSLHWQADKLLIWTSNFRISLPSLTVFIFTVSTHGLINLTLLNFPNSGVLLCLSSSFYT